MVRYIVEQRVLMYKSYVNVVARKRMRKFRLKFPGITVPSTAGIHKLSNKVRSTGSLLDKKPAEKRRVLIEEKLDEMRARSEQVTEISETPCIRDRNLEIVSNQSVETVNLNMFKWIENVCMYRDTIFSTSYNVGELSLFIAAVLESHRERLIVLGGESYNSCREPASDSCV
jgi:hypothetical protein